jgi:transposase
MGHKRDPFERAIKKVEKGKHWKRQDAIAVLEKLRDSGLSVLEFVRTYKVPEKRVRWWKRRLDDQLPQATTEQPPQFVAVQVIEAEETKPSPIPQPPITPVIQPAASLEVVLHNGRTVRVPVGFDPQTLCQVVEVLEVMPC